MKGYNLMGGQEILFRRAKSQDYESLIHLLGKFVGNEDRYKNRDNDSILKVLKNSNCYKDWLLTIHLRICFGEERRKK